MKTISILIPTYNEAGNIKLLIEEIKNEFKTNLPMYLYEIIVIDNFSTDNTRNILIESCNQDKNIKAIFNTRNFGQLNSPYYGLMQTKGDCTILICADFQDPITMIHEFVIEWEQGYKIVIGTKSSSLENRFLFFLRGIYYSLLKKMSEVDQIEHFTGFGLYDKSFIDILRTLDDPMPYLRGIVSELGMKRKEIPYTQAQRLKGKTSNNWYKLYDIGMLGVTSYTKVVIRLATMFGFLTSITSFLFGVIYLILKLIFWNRFSAGVAPLVIAIFFISAIQLFFIGLLGEYVLNINLRLLKRPLVVEEKRINFEEDKI